MRHRVEVVFNPAAGRPGRRGRLERVLRELSRLGCAVRVHETTAPGNAEAIARAAAGSAAEVIVAAGADGTINEVINGLRPGAPPLAVIPLGTANVLAAEIDLPREARRLAELIACGPACRVWPGEVNGRRFAMMAGIGFDARVVAAVCPALKRRLGRYAYVAAAAWCCAHGRRAGYEIEVDGARHAGASAIVARGRHYGGRFLLAPQASLFEPRLDLLLFASARPADVIRSAAALARGSLARDAKVRLIRAGKVRVSGPADEAVQCDGSVACRLPATITVAEEPVALVAGHSVEHGGATLGRERHT